MNRNLNQYLVELESKIHILERENEALSAKVEENLLLNRAFEEINVYDKIDNILLNTLESISVLLNILDISVMLTPLIGLIQRTDVKLTLLPIFTFS